MELVRTVFSETYLDTGLTNEQKYYYTICAFSLAGNGTMSEMLDVTPTIGGGGGDNAVLYLGIGAVAAVAVVGAALVVMKKRK